MKREMVITAMLAVFVPNVTIAQVFECGFFQENARLGKSNRASCAMHPENVFSTANDTKDRREHCDIKPVFTIENLKNVVVDLGNKKVTWISEHRTAEHAKPIMIDYYTSGKSFNKKKLSKKEAEKRVNFVKERIEHFIIKSVIHGTKDIYYNKKLQKAYSPPKTVNVKYIYFENDFYNYHLYVPEDTGEAILTQFTGDDEHTWVELIFGDCVVPQE